MYQYQVSFGEAISRAFSNYCNFSGRSSRSEYWWFWLFNLLVAGVLSAFGGGADEGSVASWWFNGLASVYGLAVLLPSLGLAVRRLHDTGRSAWNLLWALLPLVGAIVLIVFYCQASEPYPNRFGEVPNMIDRDINPI